MEMTLADTVDGVVLVFLPQGELGFGGISTYWEKKKEEELVAAALEEGAGMGAWTAAWPRGNK